jgi:hypothetical protein
MYQVLNEILSKYQSILMTVAGGVIVTCYAVIVKEWRLLRRDPARYLQKHGIAPELSVPPHVCKARVEASQKKVADALAVIRIAGKLRAEESANTDKRLAEDKARRRQEKQAIEKMLNMRLTLDPQQVEMLLSGSDSKDIVFTTKILEEAEKNHQIEQKLDTVPLPVPYQRTLPHN